MEPDTTSDVVYPPEIEELIRILQMLLDRKIVDVPPELRKQWPSVKYVLGRDVDENFPFDRCDARHPIMLVLLFS
jgi:hypothetical protein